MAATTPGALWGSNVPYIEDLYKQYQSDPTSVDGHWQDYFAALEQGVEPTYTRPGERFNPAAAGSGQSALQYQVTSLIYAYRNYGHKWAHINPLDPAPEPGHDLSLKSFGLSEENLDQEFASGGVLRKETAKLRDILAALQQTYTRTIGVQYSNLPTRAERIWLRQRMEQTMNTPTYGDAQKLKIYDALQQADSFEKFLHTKYVGQKRFSIEGGDSLIPMLKLMTELAGRQGMKDIVFGMAHRGRLNVLTNIMEKPVGEIFAQFEDALQVDYEAGSGDVKYHFGHSRDVETESGNTVHMALLSNPSHLEAVNPVVLGNARAKQQRFGADGKKQVLPLLIHGDAAVAGQGVVPESLNLAQLEGYHVGGTIHVVINNRIGYTAEPQEAFSGEYCTDVARMLQIPIFHVNGDDPEACCQAMELAMAWRQEFGRDVMIDLVCYRRYGHNEGDDPTFTQPVEYGKIKPHPAPVKTYREQLLSSGAVTEADLAKCDEKYKEKLEKAFNMVREQGVRIRPDVFGGAWEGLSSKQAKEPTTAISAKLLKTIAESMATYPESFTPHSKVDKFMQERREMLLGDKPINWGAAENAAYASLLAEGHSIRMSGQDVQRGTFAHRHAVLIDNKTGNRVMPYATLAKGKATFEIHNSSLSELAVVGFEYGYSLAAPKTLTIWEAQFGDFANGAQIMIDQFISSAETKWWRYSGLVMLLPHGYEGQGPEHSSARLERYLQLCAEENMVVANPTTPAQMFHLLRRQQLRDIRKPLIVMTPKSLLRLPEASSKPADLTKGSFQTVIADEVKNAKRVVLCSGKLYYDLKAKQQEEKRKDVALVRIEQLYPLSLNDIKAALAVHPKAELVWAQEEPRNQGAWAYLLDNLSSELPGGLTYIGRPAAATTATGSPKRHKQEQADIVAAAFSV